MKKGIILGLIVMSAFLMACAQQQFVCPDGTVVDDSTQCPVPEDPAQSEPVEDTPPAPEQQEEAPPSMIIEPEIQTLIDRAEERVTSFRYVYVGPPQNLPRDRYYVKGNRIAVELAQETDFKLSQPYTHVYMNTADKTAVAYCNVRDNIRCPDGTVRYGSVPFEKHYVRTPYQWLKDIQTAEYAGSGPQYESKSTILADFTTKDGVSGEMYIMEFMGLPGKIRLDNGQTIEFRDLATNTVTDAEVTPPEV